MLCALVVLAPLTSTVFIARSPRRETDAESLQAPRSVATADRWPTALGEMVAGLVLQKKRKARFIPR